MVSDNNNSNNSCRNDADVESMDGSANDEAPLAVFPNSERTDADKSYGQLRINYAIAIAVAIDRAADQITNPSLDSLW